MLDDPLVLKIAAGIILGVIGLYILAIAAPVMGLLLTITIRLTYEIIKAVGLGLLNAGKRITTALKRVPMWIRWGMVLIFFALILFAMVFPKDAEVAAEATPLVILAIVAWGVVGLWVVFLCSKFVNIIIRRRS